VFSLAATQVSFRAIESSHSSAAEASVFYVTLCRSMGEESPTFRRHRFPSKRRETCTTNITSDLYHQVLSITEYRLFLLRWYATVSFLQLKGITRCYS
jgi:hypothetical protein